MRNYLLIAITTTLTFCLSAQDMWDLEKCIAYAIEHSVDMQQSEYAIQDAEILNKQDRANRYPSLNASTNAFWNTGRTVDPTTNDFISTTFFSNGVSLNSNVTLFNGGRVKNTIRQSDISIKAAKEDRSSTVNNITLDVLQAYFDALFAQDNLANAQVQLKTINDQIDQMKKMVEAGTRAQFEIFDLEAQQAQAEQDITAAQNNIDLAKIRLKGVMNLPVETQMTLAKPPVDQAVYSDSEINNFNEVLDRVVAARPELRAFDYRVEGAELGVEVAKSALLPSLTFGVSFNSNFSNQFKRATEEGSIQSFDVPIVLNGNPAIITEEQFVPNSIETVPYLNQFDNNKSLGFGFNVSVPIYNNFSAKGGIERAKLNVLNQQAERDRYAINLRNTLGQLLTDVRAAKRNLEAAEKVLKAREVAFENAEKRFSVGAINSFDYTNLQDQLNRSRTDALIAKYDFVLKVKVLDFYQGYPVKLK